MTASGNSIEQNQRTRRERRYGTIVQQNTCADKNGSMTQSDKEKDTSAHNWRTLKRTTKEQKPEKRMKAEPQRKTVDIGGATLYMTSSLTAVDYTGQAITKDRDTTREM